jgi:hypothetical protein
LSTGAGNRFEYELFANTIVVLIVASGASASINLCVVDGVEWADSASSLELELSSSTGEHTHSTGVLGISGYADTLTVRDNLVGSAGIAIAIGINKLIRLTLAGAYCALECFA